MEPARSVGWGRLSDIVIDRRLVEGLEYKIQVIKDSGIRELKRARKLCVGIHEDGNTLEFKKKKCSAPSLFEIPLRDILAATPVTIQWHHIGGSKCKEKMQSSADFLAEFVDEDGKMYAEYIESKSEAIKSEPMASRVEP